LSTNAGLDATEVISKLYSKQEEGKKTWGVDVEVSTSRGEEDLSEWEWREEEIPESSQEWRRIELMLR
jgi:chaperonin GroEL (HSP60 family)